MDYEQPAQGERTAATVRAPRRRLIKGAALAGPAILTLGTRRAWAVSSCGQVLRQAESDPETDRRAALNAANHDLPENGINESCMTSSGLGN